MTKTLDPLRKVIGREPYDPYGIQVTEILECGHKQRQKEDIFGPTNAHRRRCRACRKEIKDQPKPE